MAGEECDGEGDVVVISSSELRHICAELRMLGPVAEAALGMLEAAARKGVAKPSPRAQGLRSKVAQCRDQEEAEQHDNQARGSASSEESSGQDAVDESVEATGVAGVEQNPSTGFATEEAACSDRYRTAYALAKAVEGGNTRMVKGSWLLQHGHAENVLPKRQDLPPEALWDPKDLLEKLNTSRRLADGAAVPIVAVSYCWETREHPDPRGVQLRHICSVVKHCLKECADIAIFLDWCSLWQEPRTEERQASFERALDDVDLWYAHQMTWVWLLTGTPSGASSPCYDERGWPFFERRLAGLSGHYDMLLDIGRPLDGFASYSAIQQACTAGRGAPLSPPAFSVHVQGKVLGDERDRELLVRAYERAFQQVMGSVEALSYADLGLDSSEVRLLADALRWCAGLQVLSLDGNALGRAGAEALAGALPGLRRLKGLYANQCGLGAGGAAALVAAAAGALPELAGLYLSGNGVGRAEASKLAQAFKKTHPRSLVHVS